MNKIKTVTIIGANGTMGANSAAILASFGNAKVHMLARSIEKAEEGIKIAIKSVRSDTLKNKMVAGTYKDDLKKAVQESDWVFELLAEDYSVKEPILKELSEYIKPGTIVSTVSSGLSISKLSKNLKKEDQKYYCGTHFFNPPYKLTLCELISHEDSDMQFIKEFGEYLQEILRRQVVFTNDKPAFAGNRVGFQLMNEAAIYAEKHQSLCGIALIDEIMSGFTGRAMGPLATINFVGLDVHKAIVDNLYKNTKDGAHDTFKLPDFIQKLIDQNKLGMKSGEGLYKMVKNEDGTKTKLVYDIKKDDYVPVPKFDIDFVKQAKLKIKESDYKAAMDIIKNAKGFEADICRHFLARYISYSLSMVGEVVETKEMVDKAMGFGFNWVPASAFVDFLGGIEETKNLLKVCRIEIPKDLENHKDGDFYKLQNILDARSLFIGR